MRISLALMLLLLGTIAQAKHGLVIHDAIIPAAPPSMTVRGVFMTIENTTAMDIRITKIRSPQFASAEIHQTVLQDNVYKMIKQDVLIVPAKGKIELKHGGYHLMLFDPKTPLQPGDSVTLVLTVEGGKTHKVKALVMADESPDESLPVHQH